MIPWTCRHLEDCSSGPGFDWMVWSEGIEQQALSCDAHLAEACRAVEFISSDRPCEMLVTDMRRVTESNEIRRMAEA